LAWVAEGTENFAIRPGLKELYSDLAIIVSNLLLDVKKSPAGERRPVFLKLANWGAL